MKAKHTPGPWVAEGYGGLVVNDATICLFPGSTREEAAANARLIAAAPELLAAAREAFDFLMSVDMGRWDERRNMEVRESLRAAIVKAEGKE